MHAGENKTQMNADKNKDADGYISVSICVNPRPI